MNRLLMISPCLAASLVAGAAAVAVEPPVPEQTVLKPNDRIVFLGDSITAGGTGLNGWVGLVKESLEAIHPDGNYTVDSLGYMGITVPGWISVEEKSRPETTAADVAGSHLKAGREVLGKHADVVVCMLGMNDSVHTRMRTDADYDQWLPRYEQLLTALKARLTPRVVGVATPTMHTEDPSATTNVILREMHARLYKLAAKGDVIVLPTHETMADSLLEGRDRNPGFRVTSDMIHLAPAGQLAVAMGMLKGLGEARAAVYLQEKYAPKLWGRQENPLTGWVEVLPVPLTVERQRYRLRYGLYPTPGAPVPKVAAKLPPGWNQISATNRTHPDGFISGKMEVEGLPDRLVNEVALQAGALRATVTIPAPWLIGVATEPGSNWEVKPYQVDPSGKTRYRGEYNVDKQRFPWDALFARGEGLGTMATLQPGTPITWHRHTARAGLPRGNAPGAIDMAGIPFREGRVAYGVRWLQSEREKPLRVEVASERQCHLTVWLNGTMIVQGELSRPDEGTKTLQADSTLRAGWNAVVFKCSIPFNPALNHHLAFWSFAVDLLGDGLGDGRVSTAPRGAPPAPAGGGAPASKAIVGPPFWRGTVMENEPMLFVRDEGKPVATGAMLFTPAGKPTVTHPDGVQKYVEGQDYVWKPGTNTLELTPHSRIPFKTSAEMVPPPGSPNTLHGVLWSEGRFFHDLQMQVTYEHAGKWPLPEPPLPTGLTRSLGKLRARQPVKLLALGDSITEGFNASGGTGAPPHQPSYPRLVANTLEQRFGAAVTLVNFGNRGTKADYGLQQVAKVADHKPDVVILAFGMNHGEPAPAFEAAMRRLRDAVQAACPGGDIVLVAPMTGNPCAFPADRFTGYRDALRTLTGPNVALADVTTPWLELLKRKPFADISGNNINHPNDFGHRLYAQLICELFPPTPDAKPTATRTE